MTWRHISGIMLQYTRGFPYQRSEQNDAMWVSNRDMAPLAHKSLQTDLKSAIFPGASGNSPAIFDLTVTKAKIGHALQDRMQEYW